MSNLYNVLLSLCQQRGISGYKMCKDLGIQPSVMTDLKMGRRSGVKAETASKIANYFNVTVDYLLTGEQKETPAETGEREIGFDDFTYAMYHEASELTDSDKELLLGMAKQLREARKKKDEERR